MTFRSILCRIGLHSWFTQFDKWGQAKVCRYCPVVKGVDRG